MDEISVESAKKNRPDLPGRFFESTNYIIYRTGSGYQQYPRLSLDLESTVRKN